MKYYEILRNKKKHTETRNTRKQSDSQVSTNPMHYDEKHTNKYNELLWNTKNIRIHDKKTLIYTRKHYEALGNTNTRKHLRNTCKYYEILRNN